MLLNILDDIKEEECEANMCFYDVILLRFYMDKKGLTAKNMKEVHIK